MVGELSLIVVYVCVLLVKSCDMSAVASEYQKDAQKVSKAICATYGFGDTADGIFLFFVFFGLTMLALQLIIGFASLGIESFVPKILLVARAHSISPWTIFCKVMRRKYARVLSEVAAPSTHTQSYAHHPPPLTALE